MRRVHSPSNIHTHPSNNPGGTTIVTNPTPPFSPGIPPQPAYHPNSFFAGRFHPAYQQPNQHCYQPSNGHVHRHGPTGPF